MYHGLSHHLLIKNGIQLSCDDILSFFLDLLFIKIEVIFIDIFELNRSLESSFLFIKTELNSNFLQFLDQFFKITIANMFIHHQRNKAITTKAVISLIGDIKLAWGNTTDTIEELPNIFLISPLKVVFFHLIIIEFDIQIYVERSDQNPML